MRIKISDLEKLILDVLQTRYQIEDSEKIKNVLMFGELTDKKSHGISRLVKGESSILARAPERKLSIIKKSKISEIIDGQDNSGMLVASIAMEESIRITKEHDISIIGTKNTFSTSGSLSYYVNKIALSGFISIIMARSDASIAPFGSVEKLFGTNPIAFGIPTKNTPLIFDMGTSAISFGYILNAKLKGERLPVGTCIDKNGNPTTNPDEAIEGSILPFDKSYKGSGLAMIIEILAGIFPGAGYIDIDNKLNGWGNLFITLSPDLLIETDEFQNKIEGFRKRLLNAKTKDGKKIRIPGENGINIMKNNIKNGYIEVDENIINEIKMYIKK